MKNYLIYILFFLVLGCQEEKQPNTTKFNSDQWLRGDIRTRGEMVDHIIKDSLLIGKSKREIIDLLGEQKDTTGNFSYPVDIGLNSGPLGLGGKWIFDLNIHFDTISNKVIEVRCND